MANWTGLKAAVSAVIKTNGLEQITGQILQNTLNTIISNLGEDASFKGLAVPTTVPGTPDGTVFYLSTEPGIYSNFNSYTSYGGLTIHYWNGSWLNLKIDSEVQNVQFYKTYDVNWNYKGTAKSGMLTPTDILNDLYVPTENGTIFGETITDFKTQVLVGTGDNGYKLRYLVKNIFYPTVTAGKTINEFGQFADTVITLGATGDFIPLLDYDELVYYGRLEPGTGVELAFYTDDNESSFLSRYETPGVYKILRVIIPIGAKYVRAGTRDVSSLAISLERTNGVRSMIINGDYYPFGIATIGQYGYPESWAVKWKNGTDGIFSYYSWSDENQMYTGYEVTYGTTYKLVQPAVTVNNYAITNIPERKIQTL